MGNETITLRIDGRPAERSVDRLQGRIERAGREGGASLTRNIAASLGIPKIGLAGATAALAAGAAIHQGAAAFAQRASDPTVSFNTAAREGVTAGIGAIPIVGQFGAAAINRAIGADVSTEQLTRSRIEGFFTQRAAAGAPASIDEIQSAFRSLEGSSRRVIDTQITLGQVQGSREPGIADVISNSIRGAFLWLANIGDVKQTVNGG